MESILMENVSYRSSHSHPGYGRHYSKTYQEGYYYYQWAFLEKPFLSKLFQKFKKQEVIENYLDFACGTGRIIGLAERYFDKVYGVDISSAMLEVAKENCHKAQFIQKDMTEEGLNKTFDLVTAFRFFVNAEEALKKSALEVIFSHLNPGGILVANIHQNKSSPLGFIMGAINKIKRKPVYSVMSYQEFCTLLKEYHFEIEEVFWYSFLPRTGRYFPWVSRFFLTPLDNFINKVPFIPKTWAQSFIIIARKPYSKKD